MEGELIEVSKKQYKELEAMCLELWHDAYDGLLGSRQVGYMLEKFQSEKAFEKQMSEENYRYYFIVCGGERAVLRFATAERRVVFIQTLSCGKFSRKEPRGGYSAKNPFFRKERGKGKSLSYRQ